MNLGARRVTAVRTDDDAFEALFTAEYGRVVGIANRVLADPHEAEDVAQEVFIDFHRLHAASADYAPAWLHRAAAHSSLNRLRGARRRQKREFAQAMEEGERRSIPRSSWRWGRTGAGYAKRSAAWRPSPPRCLYCAPADSAMPRSRRRSASASVRSELC